MGTSDKSTASEPHAPTDTIPSSKSEKRRLLAKAHKKQTVGTIQATISTASSSDEEKQQQQPMQQQQSSAAPASLSEKRRRALSRVSTRMTTASKPALESNSNSNDSSRVSSNPSTSPPEQEQQQEQQQEKHSRSSSTLKSKLYPPTKASTGIKSLAKEHLYAPKYKQPPKSLQQPEQPQQEEAVQETSPTATNTNNSASHRSNHSLLNKRLGAKTMVRRNSNLRPAPLPQNTAIPQLVTENSTTLAAEKPAMTEFTVNARTNNATTKASQARSVTTKNSTSVKAALSAPRPRLRLGAETSLGRELEEPEPKPNRPATTTTTAPQAERKTTGAASRSLYSSYDAQKRLFRSSSPNPSAMSKTPATAQSDQHTQPEQPSRPTFMMPQKDYRTAAAMGELGLTGKRKPAKRPESQVKEQEVATATSTNKTYQRPRFFPKDILQDRSKDQDDVPGRADTTNNLTNAGSASSCNANPAPCEVDDVQSSEVTVEISDFTVSTVNLPPPQRPEETGSDVSQPSKLMMMSESCDSSESNHDDHQEEEPEVSALTATQNNKQEDTSNHDRSARLSVSQIRSRFSGSSSITPTRQDYNALQHAPPPPPPPPPPPQRMGYRTSSPMPTPSPVPPPRSVRGLSPMLPPTTSSQPQRCTTPSVGAPSPVSSSYHHSRSASPVAIETLVPPELTCSHPVPKPAQLSPIAQHKPSSTSAFGVLPATESNSMAAKPVSAQPRVMPDRPRSSLARQQQQQPSYIHQLSPAHSMQERQVEEQNLQERPSSSLESKQPDQVTSSVQDRQSGFVGRYQAHGHQQQNQAKPSTQYTSLGSQQQQHGRHSPAPSLGSSSVMGRQTPSRQMTSQSVVTQPVGAPGLGPVSPHKGSRDQKHSFDVPPPPTTHDSALDGNRLNFPEEARAALQMPNTEGYHSTIEQVNSFPLENTSRNPMPATPPHNQTHTPEDIPGIADDQVVPNHHALTQNQQPSRSFASAHTTANRPRPNQYARINPQMQHQPSNAASKHEEEEQDATVISRTQPSISSENSHQTRQDHDGHVRSSNPAHSLGMTATAGLERPLPQQSPRSQTTSLDGGRITIETPESVRVSKFKAQFDKPENMALHPDKSISSNPAGKWQQARTSSSSDRQEVESETHSHHIPKDDTPNQTPLNDGGHHLPQHVPPVQSQGNKRISRRETHLEDSDQVPEPHIPHGKLLEAPSHVHNDENDQQQNQQPRQGRPTTSIMDYWKTRIDGTESARSSLDNSEQASRDRSGSPPKSPRGKWNGRQSQSLSPKKSSELGAIETPVQGNSQAVIEVPEKRSVANMADKFRHEQQQKGAFRVPESPTPFSASQQKQSHGKWQQGEQMPSTTLTRNNTGIVEVNATLKRWRNTSPSPAHHGQGPALPHATQEQAKWRSQSPARSEASSEVIKWKAGRPVVESSRYDSTQPVSPSRARALQEQARWRSPSPQHSETSEGTRLKSSVARPSWTRVNTASSPERGASTFGPHSPNTRLSPRRSGAAEHRQSSSPRSGPSPTSWKSGSTNSGSPEHRSWKRDGGNTSNDRRSTGLNALGQERAHYGSQSGSSPRSRSQYPNNGRRFFDPDEHSEASSSVASMRPALSPTSYQNRGIDQSRTSPGRKVTDFDRGGIRDVSESNPHESGLLGRVSSPMGNEYPKPRSPSRSDVGSARATQDTSYLRLSMSSTGPGSGVGAPRNAYSSTPPKLPAEARSKDAFQELQQKLLKRQHDIEITSMASTPNIQNLSAMTVARAAASVMDHVDEDNTETIHEDNTGNIDEYEDEKKSADVDENPPLDHSMEKEPPRHIELGKLAAESIHAVDYEQESRELETNSRSSSPSLDGEEPNKDVSVIPDDQDVPPEFGQEITPSFPPVESENQACEQEPTQMQENAEKDIVFGDPDTYGAAGGGFNSAPPTVADRAKAIVHWRGGVGAKRKPLDSSDNAGPYVQQQIQDNRPNPLPENSSAMTTTTDCYPSIASKEPESSTQSRSKRGASAVVRFWNQTTPEDLEKAELFKDDDPAVTDYVSDVQFSDVLEKPRVDANRLISPTVVRDMRHTRSRTDRQTEGTDKPPVGLKFETHGQTEASEKKIMPELETGQQRRTGSADKDTGGLIAATKRSDGAEPDPFSPGAVSHLKLQSKTLDGAFNPFMGDVDGFETRTGFADGGGFVDRDKFPPPAGFGGDDGFGFQKVPGFGVPGEGFVPTDEKANDVSFGGDTGFDMSSGFGSVGFSTRDVFGVENPSSTKKAFGANGGNHTAAFPVTHGFGESSRDSIDAFAQRSGTEKRSFSSTGLDAVQGKNSFAPTAGTMNKVSDSFDEFSGFGIGEPENSFANVGAAKQNESVPMDGFMSGFERAQGQNVFSRSRVAENLDSDSMDGFGSGFKTAQGHQAFARSSEVGKNGSDGFVSAFEEVHMETAFTKSSGAKNEGSRSIDGFNSSFQVFAQKLQARSKDTDRVGGPNFATQVQNTSSQRSDVKTRDSGIVDGFGSGFEAAQAQTTVSHRSDAKNNAIGTLDGFSSGFSSGKEVLHLQTESSQRSETENNADGFGSAFEVGRLQEQNASSQRPDIKTRDSGNVDGFGSGFEAAQPQTTVSHRSDAKNNAIGTLDGFSSGFSSGLEVLHLQTESSQRSETENNADGFGSAFEVGRLQEQNASSQRPDIKTRDSGNVDGFGSGFEAQATVSHRSDAKNNTIGTLDGFGSGFSSGLEVLHLQTESSQRSETENNTDGFGSAFEVGRLRDSISQNSKEKNGEAVRHKEFSSALAGEVEEGGEPDDLFLPSSSSSQKVEGKVGTSGSQESKFRSSSRSEGDGAARALPRQETDSSLETYQRQQNTFDRLYAEDGTQDPLWSFETGIGTYFERADRQEPDPAVISESVQASDLPRIEETSPGTTLEFSC